MGSQGCCKSNARFGASLTTSVTGLIFIAKVLSVIDDAPKDFKEEAVGKYINSICYVPGGYTHYETLEEAVLEEIRCSGIGTEFSSLYTSMARKHLYGYKDLEFIKVEVTTIRQGQTKET